MKFQANEGLVQIKMRVSQCVDVVVCQPSLTFSPIDVCRVVCQ